MFLFILSSLFIFVLLFFFSSLITFLLSIILHLLFILFFIMAKEPQEFANIQKCCIRFGSFNTKFKYLNNGKATQPRYQCHDCKNYFQVINQNRKTPMKYLKPKHQDPHELQGLFKMCPFPSCGAKNKAMFKYYNNKSKCGPTQPHFQCLKCCKQFQMYFEGGQLLFSKGKRAP